MLMLVVAATALLPTTPASRVAGLRMQVGMTGGDLEGGGNEQRNAEVRALKKLFYSAADDTATAGAGEEHLGMLRDIPIARFRMTLLPHQQAAFNIFQPQLVHMFESLLATPKPWLYMHAILPGGAENLWISLTV